MFLDLPVPLFRLVGRRDGNQFRPVASELVVHSGGEVMTDWHVGQKIVCVRPPKPEPSVRTVPVRGGIYTIRKIDFDGGMTCFLLEEVVNPEAVLTDTDGGKEFGEPLFCASRFRPVVLSESDISIFTEILDRVNKREKVDA